MLIKALSDYYDILAAEGKILPDGYSKVNVHYMICLNAEGKIEDIIDCQEKIQNKTDKGKIKEKWVPRIEEMPQRTEKTGIDSNIVEHRPLYIFGLNWEEEGLTPDDRTGKARKSHEAFVKSNLEFLEGIDSPVVNAYRNFLRTWKPEEETENEKLLMLGKNYGKSCFAFCLTGYPDLPLHNDRKVRQKWEQVYRGGTSENKKGYAAQCAVSGEECEIARIHNKIKGVYGGLATGSVLIGFNNPSESSYGNEQSFNSNISQTVMKKYTEALNFLLATSNHKILLDDMTIVFWAMDTGEVYEDMILAMLCGQSDKMNAEETEGMLKNLLASGRSGKVTEGRLQSLSMIESDVDFYMLGLKPNSSRLSVKFIFRKKYADLLWNIAQFQKDIQISEELYPVSFSRIKEELRSPKSTSEKINPALLTKLFESVIYGNMYPTTLLETVVRRVKTDRKKGVNRVRAGIIKACINRNYKREEFGVALDKENCGQAYVCGRLFAVLEKLQRDASGTKLNRTIKDAYFASASAKPAMIFPKLIKLAQNHLNKVNSPTYYSILLGEIMDKLNGEFPETLLLQDQGRFIIGYYQQYQSFFEKKGKTENNEMEEN
ncbi:MAG: type I-C CRISPR-associated protein Cas8c/Csd1 [Lachnospiraceae bacterium]|nr:type I-C CRISPR-associated protein Cas8c/Csd1 [Lachnospiraceae bacterium]